MNGPCRAHLSWAQCREEPLSPRCSGICVTSQREMGCRGVRRMALGCLLISRGRSTFHIRSHFQQNRQDPHGILLLHCQVTKPDSLLCHSMRQVTVRSFPSHPGCLPCSSSGPRGPIPQTAPSPLPISKAESGHRSLRGFGNRVLSRAGRPGSPVILAMPPEFASRPQWH